MAYEKQTWATGQVITAEKLNHIEDGIEAVEQEIPTDAYEKPAGGIPDADIASASVWNAKGTYSKPSGGIPATDLATAVQTSLGKADTALQTETDPTVPSWAKASAKPTYTASEVGAIASPSSPATGAFLVWNGTAWVAQTLSTWSGGNY